ncbi:MAG: hypothetical protein KKE20_04895 [Nanoarchaeota archaeon]|nr:hypothetical protein [Nanoarchaeota archaeon]
MENKLYLMGALCMIIILIASCSQSSFDEVPQNSQNTAPAQSGSADTEPSAATDSKPASTTSSSGTDVKCDQDSDCGNEVIGEPYCFQGSILTPRNMPKCTYPGTVNSYCSMENKDKVEFCSSGEFCRDGTCLVLSEQPCEDTDGGKDYETFGRVTDGKLEVFNDDCQDDKVLLERYCSDGGFGRGLTDEHRCLYKCSGGKCIDRDE